jgi:histidine triad (HIT) family protein
MEKYTHAPENYICPICVTISGVDDDTTWIKQDDVFYRDELVLCFISSKFITGNEGHAIIVPIKHFENIYDLPQSYGERIMEVVKKISIALKHTRKCDGITILQNNEPASDQHAFHHHTHIIPRFTSDNFHEELWKAKKSSPEDRPQYTKPLKDFLA